MITLSRDYNFSLGRDVDAYFQTADYSNKSFKKFRDAHRPITVRDGAIKYLTNRGISEDVIRMYEVTTRAEDENIIVFPFKDETGELTTVKYRKANFEKGKDKNKEWFEKDCKPILFGMYQCGTNDTLIITEGQIDSLSIATAGYDNAVSVPGGARGFTWVPYCWDYINKFSNIIIFGDCENGKVTLADELSKRWPLKVKVVRVEDYQGCKDANEILQKLGNEQIVRCINNAESVQYNAIKPLSSVRMIDIMKIQHIPTGFKSIDERLDGGFRMGQLAILTGKRGDGKSTLASMFAIQAIEYGHNCFFYSGELPDFYFRNWMDCQVTGKGDITQSDSDKLDKYYGKKAYIYDEKLIEEDEYTDLLSNIEIAIVQKSCSFILIDNLMTALEDDLTTDLYRSQSKFVGELTKLAKKYSVFILLIAHPRKTNGRLDNDSISGSSNITDKADLTLFFSRPERGDDDLDEHIRLLEIQKNRLTGKLTKAPVRITYDPTGSRRLAQEWDDFKTIKYSWDNDDDFYQESIEEIPF